MRSPVSHYLNLSPVHFTILTVCSFSVAFKPSDDVVYMENDEERNEYVLADTGNIWVGSARNNTGIPWNFGQVNGYSQLFLNLLSTSIHVKFSRLVSIHFLKQLGDHDCQEPFLFLMH